MAWAMYGEQPPCEHLVALKDYLIENGIAIRSERGEQPAGWVNVHCRSCFRTYETTLREPWDDDADEGDEGDE